MACHQLCVHFIYPFATRFCIPQSRDTRVERQRVANACALACGVTRCNHKHTNKAADQGARTRNDDTTTGSSSISPIRRRVTFGALRVCVRVERASGRFVGYAVFAQPHHLPVRYERLCARLSFDKGAQQFSGSPATLAAVALCKDTTRYMGWLDNYDEICVYGAQS